MSPSARGFGVKAPPTTDKSDVQHWLDALVSNSCSQEGFLQQVYKLQADNADVAWEALALLDQYARRKLISREVFESLKAPLQHLSLGVGDSPPPPAAPRDPPKPLAQVSPTTTTTDIIRRPLQAGDLLRGRYRVVDVIRQDGSDTFVEALDERTTHVPGHRSRRAIQVRLGVQPDDPELVQRLYNLQALSHPGIVRVFDVEAETDAVYLITEWLTGISLQHLMEQNGNARLALPAAQTIVRSLASALAYAHSRGVCHGDVRAGNMFITDTGEIRLKGFDIGSNWQVNPRSDRVAFAQLAFELLSGSHWSGAESGGLTKRTRLREPRGLTRDQWRVLRDTLLGRDGRRKGDVLTMFAGSDDVATGRVTLPQAFVRTPINLRVLNTAMAWGIVVALLGAAGYLLVSQGDSTTPVAARIATANSPVVEIPPAIEQPPAVAGLSEPASASAPAVTAATPPDVAPVPPPETPSPSRYVPALVDLPFDTLEVRSDQPVARIWVRRRGGLNRAVTFRWWTESGSAKPEVDFGAVRPQMAEIPDGAHGVALMVPLVSDPSRGGPRTFYVKIDETGPDATLGERTLVQVTLLPADASD